MKKFQLIAIFALVVSISCAQESPRKEAKGMIDKVNVTVDYGSPSVKGRTIWGSLEQYGKVWRAGANENTRVTFDKAVKIGDTNVKAGTYGFFIIPNESSDWVVIFSSKNDAWGAYSYAEADDVVRVNIKPSFVDDNQESLQYSVGRKSIDFAWAKARLSIPILKK